MSLRVCPNCQIMLGNYDHYFCTSCGATLPKELVDNQTNLKIQKYDSSVSQTSTSFIEKIGLSKLTKAFNKRTIIAFVILAISVIGLVQIENRIEKFLKKSNFIQSPLKTAEESSPSAKAAKHVLNLHLPLKSSEISNVDINEYIPAEADLYVFGNNLGFLLSNLSQSSIYKELLSKLPASLDSSFVVFSLEKDKKRMWALITKNQSDVENEILKSSLPSNLTYKVINNYLVVSSDVSIFDMMKNSKEKTLLNLALSPTYVKVKDFVPKEGQVEIIFMSDKGKEIFLGLKEKKIGDALKNIIDAVLKTGYNEVVVM